MAEAGHLSRRGAFLHLAAGIAFNEFRIARRGQKELALEDIGESEAPQEGIAAATDSGLRMDLAEALNSLHAAERAAITLLSKWSLA